MMRPEFEAYEKRVEDVLTKIGASIDEADLKDFGEMAAAAREIVEMRRAHLEITEQQAPSDDLQFAERIERLEKIRNEQNISYSAGSDGKSLPGPASEHLTVEDSEAAWARYDRLRADLIEAEANLARAMEKPDAETLVVEPANDTASKSAPDTTARSPDQAAETTYQVSARQEAVARHGEREWLYSRDAVASRP
jgi:hypothetical protein